MNEMICRVPKDKSKKNEVKVVKVSKFQSAQTSDALAAAMAAVGVSGEDLAARSAVWPEFMSVAEVIDGPSKNGSRPLHVAAAFDSREAITALLRHGAQVGSRDSVSETPLHRAARRNYMVSYRLLTEAGADENEKNAMHESARDLRIDVNYY